MWLGLFIYLAWAVELSGISRAVPGMFLPCWLHVALVFVIWHARGASSVLWGAVVGLLLDLLTGQVGVHLLLASTLAMVASDWRQSKLNRNGLTLAIVAAAIIATMSLAVELWKGLPTGDVPPAQQLASMVLGPAIAAAFTALAIRLSGQAVHLGLKSVLGFEAGAD
jgi:rod shape-determining protein MreD